MSETEAVRLQMDAAGDHVRTLVLTLTDTEVLSLKKYQRVKMFTREYRVHVLSKAKDGPAYRYAIFLQEPGQHEYMDLVYGVDPGGEIHRVDLLVYREPYGGEIEGRRFMKQFEGKSLSNAKFRVNSDVVHIVGATISANSVSFAARRALGILQLRGYIP